MLDARFWSKVDTTGGALACWPWMGARSQTGYGRFKNYGSAVAHRLVLEDTIGRALRPGELALHHCDNPPCCNPHHLYVGTHADNMRDMSVRGRVARRTVWGERHGSHRLTEFDVLTINDRLERGHRGVDIARDYGMSPSTVSAIKTGRLWRHLR